MDENVEQFLEDIQSASETVAEEIRYLEEYRNWLDEAEDEWDNRTNAEQESFRESAEDLIIELRTNDPEWDFISEFSVQLQQSYKEPVLESIQNSINQIASLLNVETNELDLTTESLRDRFESSSAAVREEYQESLHKLQKADQIVLDYLSPQYDNDPFLLFQSSQLVADIKRASERSSTLQDLINHLADIGWLSGETESVLLSPTRLDSEVPTSSDLSEYISIIEETIADFRATELDVKEPISRSLLDELSDSDIETAFEETALRSNELSKEFGRVDQVIDVIDLNEDEYPIGGVVSDWESIVKSNYNSISELSRTVDGFIDSFNSWCHQQSSRWSEIREVARYYIQELDEVDTDPPTKVQEHVENGLEFRDGVVNSLKIIQETEEWLESQREALRDELGDEAVNLLDDLIEKSEVNVNDYSTDTIDTVSQNIDLVLRIDDES